MKGRSWGNPFTVTTALLCLLLFTGFSSSWEGCDRCDPSECDNVENLPGQDDPDLLAIGDSVMAYYHRSRSGPPCCKAISDWASQDLQEYIWSWARGDARLSGGNELAIPDQYCEATRGELGSGQPSTWDPVTATCAEDIGQTVKTYDWVLLNGGGDDLLFETCSIQLGQDCARVEEEGNGYVLLGECAAELLGLKAELQDLVAYIRGHDGSRVLLVGYYELLEPTPPISGEPYHWYNSCLQAADLLGGEIADELSAAHGEVYYLSSADVLSSYNPNYKARSNFYGTDGIHPSLTTTERIGHAAADLIGPLR